MCGLRDVYTGNICETLVYGLLHFCYGLLNFLNQGIQIYLNPLVTFDPEGRGRSGQGWRLRLHKRSAEDGGALEGTGGRAPLSSLLEFR